MRTLRGRFATSSHLRRALWPLQVPLAAPGAEPRRRASWLGCASVSPSVWRGGDPGVPASESPRALAVHTLGGRSPGRLARLLRAGEHRRPPHLGDRGSPSARQGAPRDRRAGPGSHAQPHVPGLGSQAPAAGGASRGEGRRVTFPRKICAGLAPGPGLSHQGRAAPRAPPAPHPSRGRGRPRPRRQPERDSGGQAWLYWLRGWGGGVAVPSTGPSPVPGRAGVGGGRGRRLLLLASSWGPRHRQWGRRARGRESPERGWRL